MKIPDELLEAWKSRRDRNQPPLISSPREPPVSGSDSTVKGD